MLYILIREKNMTDVNCRIHRKYHPREKTISKYKNKHYKKVRNRCKLYFLCLAMKKTMDLLCETAKTNKDSLGKFFS